MRALDDLFLFFTDFNVILIIAEMFYCIRLKRRKYFLARLVLPVLYCVLFSFGPVKMALGTIHIIIFLYNLVPFLNMYYLVMIAVSIGILFFCFDEKPLVLVFYSISAFILEHFCSHAMQLFTYVLQGHHITIPTISRVFETVLLITVLFLIDTVWIRKFNQQEIVIKNRNMIIFVTLTTVLVSAFSSYVYYAEYVTPVTHVYELAICLLLILVQHGFFNISEREMEKRIMENMLREQGKQQLLYNENMKYINIKCHDLKNQIHVLSMVQSEDERHRNIEELTQAVLLQESYTRTGNEVLDVVLMEKNLLCQNNNITLSCLVDGTACDFMEATDICMLFGNVLNNAIEAAKQCEIDKRDISMHIYRENSFVRILVENFFAGKLNKEGTSLSTIKNNDSFEHGFGMKSISFIVEKYNGNLTIATEEDVFRLNILFPFTDSL